MSGPIVRKYGFPNFEKIFGPKPVQHGVDQNQERTDSSSDTTLDSNESAKKVDPSSTDTPNVRS